MKSAFAIISFDVAPPSLSLFLTAIKKFSNSSFVCAKSCASSKDVMKRCFSASFTLEFKFLIATKERAFLVCAVANMPLTIVLICWLFIFLCLNDKTKI